MKCSLEIIILILLLVSCNTDERSSNVEGSLNYERIIVEGEYGFLNNDGDTIINLGKYKYLNPIDEQGMILAERNGKHGYINIHEEIIIPFDYDDLSVFTLGLAPAQKKGKYGFINRDGKVSIDFMYDNESHFNKCGLAKAQIGDKYGFINTKGDQVIPITFDKVRGNKIDSVACALKDDKWAFFSCDGKQLSEFEFDKITESYFDGRNNTFFKSGPCKVVRNGRSSYINSGLEEVIDPGKYETAQLFRNHLAIVSKDGRYGIIDSIGNEVYPLNFEYIDHLKKWSNESDLFVLTRDTRYQFLDSKASPLTAFDIVDFTWDVFGGNDDFQRGFILINEENKYGIVTERGELTSAFIYDMIEPFDGRSSTPAEMGRKFGLIGMDGKTALPFEYDKIESIRSTKLFHAKKAGKAGIINSSGESLIPFVYASVEPIYYDYKHKFIVERNGLFGIININNEIIAPLEYDKISNWVEYGPDEHYVVKNGKKGLMGRDGEIIIPLMYDEIYTDNPELILVKNNGLLGTVNYNNSIVHEIEYDGIFWELPILKYNSLDTIYLNKDGQFFTTNLKGVVMERNIEDDIIRQKNGHLLSDKGY